jgi:hypothetical protein
MTATTHCHSEDTPMKYCRWCERDKPLADFYPHPEMADGHLNKCMACVKRYAQDRRLTSDRPREIDNRRYHEGTKRAYMFARARTHPKPAIVSSAQSKVANALRTGKLTRPIQCEFCEAAPVFTEAAHHDYTKPLDVIWLCRRCHRRWDSRDPKAARAAS